MLSMRYAVAATSVRRSVGAIRLGIARALEAYDPNLRQLLAPGNKMILIYLRCCLSIQLTF